MDKYPLFVPGLTSKTVASADGTLIYCEAVGDPVKRPIVFVHGFATSAEVFNTLFVDAKLRERLYLVRYDWRGNARSGQPENEEAYVSQRFAEDFEAVCKAFQLEKPIFAGWSMGGAIASDIISHLGPSAVSGFVHIATLPWMDVRTSLAVAKPLVIELNRLMLSADTTVQHPALLLFARACFAEPDRAPFALVASMVGVMAMQLPGVRRQLLARKQDPGPMFEASARLPSLLVHGDQDELVDCAKTIEIMHKYMPSVMVRTMRGVGHTPFVEDPNTFSEIVLQFVEELDAGRLSP